MCYCRWVCVCTWGGRWWASSCTSTACWMLSCRNRSSLPTPSQILQILQVLFWRLSPTYPPTRCHLSGDYSDGRWCDCAQSAGWDKVLLATTRPRSHWGKSLVGFTRRLSFDHTWGKSLVGFTLRYIFWFSFRSNLLISCLCLCMYHDNMHYYYQEINFRNAQMCLLKPLFQGHHEGYDF